MTDQSPIPTGRVALLDLPADCVTAWSSAAAAIGATIDPTATPAACAVHANSPQPLVIVACGTRPLDGRLFDPANNIFRVATVVVVIQREDEAAYWRAVAWDTAPAVAAANVLEEVLRAALAESASRKAAWEEVESFRERSRSLTEPEQRVFESVCAGKLNKQMASEMRVSIRTVEQRRRRVFEKMGVESAVPLASLASAVAALESHARRMHRNLSGAVIPPPGRLG
ncbi:MAG: LuxR C-terminal-related transcriptional regulator [Planctomycetota bacterium]